MKNETAQSAVVTRTGSLDMQVCVPADWSDEQIVRFAEQENPCGTRNGWMIRRVGDPMLGGQPERVDCADRKGFVHVVLDD